MNALSAIHDRGLLWLVQEGLYAYSPLTIVPFAFALVALPTHRRLGLTITLLASVTALACLLWYGALIEAPLLAWTLIFGLTYRGTQLIPWLLPSSSPPAGFEARSWTRRLRPRTSWFNAIARDYLRADPRGVYWFDLARAAHGLPLQRSRDDRQQLLLASPDLPTWRRRFWHGPLAWLAEARIGLLNRLPRYWIREHRELELAEPAMRFVLRQEIERTERAMMQCQAGANFDDFRSRSPELHDRQAALAGKYGHVHCLLREAVVEYLTFRMPWNEEKPGLLDAAFECYETWQFRTQFDSLWRTPAPKSDESHAQAEPDEEIVEESEPQLIEESPSQDDDRLLTDEALFDLVAPEIPEDACVSDSPNQAAAIDHRQLDRLRDLQTACSLLEAFLGAAATGDFHDDVRRWERLLDRPSFRLPAMMLLMLQCLRTDQSSPQTDRLKLDIRARLRGRFRGPVSTDSAVRRERQAFESLYVDLLYDRGEFANVRSLFSDREELSAYQWKLLGDATSSLATQLSGQEELRDQLQYEAIGFYFRSGQQGVWTLRTAGALLGVDSTRSLVDQFNRHPVKVSRPLAGSLASTAGTRVGKIESENEEYEEEATRKSEVRPVPAAKPPASTPALPVIAKVEPPIAKPAPAKPAPPPPRVAKPVPAKPVPPPVAKPVPVKPAPPPVAKPEAARPVAIPVAKPAKPVPPPVAKPAVAAKVAPANPAVEVEVYSIRGGVSRSETIVKLPYTIGAAAPANLVVADAKLAPVHYMLNWENGKLVMRDPYGKGVLVNGSPTKLATLNIGDRVQAGETILEVKAI